MRVLYISQTGMSEPLGQSQVLGYLVGLAARGFEIDIVSFEPRSAKPEALEVARRRMQDAGIRWVSLPRSSSHHMSVKLAESAMGVVRAIGQAVLRRPRIVHARSYFATAIADVVASSLPGAKLLFDCRGMLGDEYLDAGHWTRDRPEYRLLKLYEKRAFARADGIVVLTAALRRWLAAQGLVATDRHIEDIPCCVDTHRFKVDESARARTRAELGLGTAPVVTYAGSLGAWYLEDEMLAFVSELRARRPGTVFVVATHVDSTAFRARAAAAGFDERNMRIVNLPPVRMPELLAAGDVGLSFIRSCFSKMGSSPTKVAEYLATGQILVANTGVGDVEDLADEAGAVVLPSFEGGAIAAAAEAVSARLEEPYAQRSASANSLGKARFGLDAVGVPRYERLYRALDAA